MKPLRRTLIVLLTLLVISEPMIPLRATAQTSGVWGWFHVIWIDSPPGPSVRYVLIDDHGQWIDLVLDEALLRAQGGARRLNGQRVRVIGTARPGLSARPLMDVLRIEPGAGSLLTTTPLTVSGAHPWITILCRFGDLTAVTPHDVPWFEGLMGSVYPGMDHYWQEVSYGNINLNGSHVVGWYNLPHPRSHYVYDIDGDGTKESHAQRLLEDCTAQADADVFFPSFAGISLMFNGDLLCGGGLCAFGGSTTLMRDALPKQYAVAWMPSTYFVQGIQAHEMGHGFGLPHSSGPYAQIYDSFWDVMSAPTQQGQCLAHPQYGCAGVHPISHHKDLLGWITPARKFVPSPGTRQTIVLERLGQPAAGGNYLMAQIPIAKSTGQFYTIEARRAVGYDVEIPGDAIVIHRVNPTIPDLNTPHARVVDPDGNGNPNDEGAMWKPGETWEDAANGVTVSVEATTETGFLVTISYAPPAALIVNGDMETDGNADGVPDGWTRITDGNDRQKCNAFGKVFSHTGTCAFRFKGAVSPGAGTLKQVIARSGAAGDALELRLFAQVKNLPAGGGMVVLKVRNTTTGTLEKAVLQVPAGTYSYQEMSLTHVVGSANPLLSAYNRIVVSIKMAGPVGTALLIDGVSLFLTTP